MKKKFNPLVAQREPTSTLFAGPGGNNNSKFTRRNFVKSAGAAAFGLSAASFVRL